MAEKTYRIGRKDITVRETFVDRMINYVNPTEGRKRLNARVQMAMLGGYAGGSRTKRSLKKYNPLGNSADADILLDLPTLRARSRDLTRNTPLATGAVATMVTSVVGPGLRAKSNIDHKVLGIDEKAADEWERKAEQLWSMWAGTTECDATRTQTFAELQGMVFRGVLESGDIFTLMPSVEREGSPFRLRLQTIEADRVANKDLARDSEVLAGGVELDEYGAPEKYHIMKAHPGDAFGKNREWQEVLAFGPRSGRRQVLHLYDRLRPGQTRGVPYLAPVIDALKQLGDYTDLELTAAVTAGLYTVFIETEGGDVDIDITNTKDETGATASDDDIQLGAGAVVGLAPGEKVSAPNPGRPNDAFDPFVIAISRQIGAAIELPYEILIKHFSSSYSAARAALLEAWRSYRRRRSWMVNGYCQPVWESFITECVARGLLTAPGFFNDPIKRHAWLAASWIGLPQGHIQPLQEAKAMRERTEGGFTTIDEETAGYSGGSWGKNHPQSVKENNARTKAGLSEAKALSPEVPPQTLEDIKDNE